MPINLIVRHSKVIRMILSFEATGSQDGLHRISDWL